MNNNIHARAWNDQKSRAMAHFPCLVRTNNAYNLCLYYVKHATCNIAWTQIILYSSETNFFEKRTLFHGSHFIQNFQRKSYNCNNLSTCNNRYLILILERISFISIVFILLLEFRTTSPFPCINSLFPMGESYPENTT